MIEFIGLSIKRRYNAKSGCFKINGNVINNPIDYQACLKIKACSYNAFFCMNEYQKNQF